MKAKLAKIIGVILAVAGCMMFPLVGDSEVSWHPYALATAALVCFAAGSKILEKYDPEDDQPPV